MRGSEHAERLRINTLALWAAQDGVATDVELAEAAAITVGSVRRKIGEGKLVRPFPGVVAAHLALRPRGWWRAGLKSCGEDRSALHLWTCGAHRGLLARRERIYVVTEKQVRPRPGLVIARARALHLDDIEVVDGLRCTTAERLVLDMAPHLSDRKLAGLIDEADRRHLLSEARILATLARHPTAPGRARTRAAFAASNADLDLRFALEQAMPGVIALARVPKPVYNTLVLDVLVDVLFRDVGLRIELDGFRNHGKRPAFRGDRASDRKLRLAGFEHERLTWDDVVLEPAKAAEELAGLHAAAALTFPIRAVHHPALREEAGL